MVEKLHYSVWHRIRVMFFVFSLFPSFVFFYNFSFLLRFEISSLCLLSVWAIERGAKQCKAVQSSAKRKKEKNEIGNPARCVAAAANIYIYDYVFERAFRSFRFRTLLPRGVRKKKNVARHETSVLNVETTISTESQFENTIKFYRCHTHKSNRLWIPYVLRTKH